MQDDSPDKPKALEDAELEHGGLWHHVELKSFCGEQFILLRQDKLEKQIIHSLRDWGGTLVEFGDESLRWGGRGNSPEGFECPRYKIRQGNVPRIHIFAILEEAEDQAALSIVFFVLF